MQLKIEVIRTAPKVAEKMDNNALPLYAAIKTPVSLVSNQSAYIPTGIKVSYDKNKFQAMIVTDESLWTEERKLSIQGKVLVGDDDEVKVLLANHAPTVDKVMPDQLIGKLVLFALPASVDVKIEGDKKPKKEHKPNAENSGTTKS